MGGGGHAVAQLFEALRYKPDVRGFDSRLSEFFRPHYGHTVDSASNRYVYQQYFGRERGGIKAAGV
jgi:hypothetical protein